MTTAQVYRKISSLTNRIREEGTAKKRRDLCVDLREMLSEPRNREMLLNEGMERGGKLALSSVWSMILKAALLVATKSITKKANKFSKDDLAIPYLMLLRLNDFSTFANMDSLLPSNDVRELLKFSLDHLSDENAKAVAEDSLLKMLGHMCSRPDYVAHFRPHHEMSAILSELQIRLDEPDSTVFENAAKAFAALMKTAKTVGIGMHILMPSCLEMVDDWCLGRLGTNFDVKASDLVGLEHMYGATTALLTSHPEQAIVDFARRGRSMLKLAKRCYPNARIKQKREALIEYFLSHL